MDPKLTTLITTYQNHIQAHRALGRVNTMQDWFNLKGLVGDNATISSLALAAILIGYTWPKFVLELGTLWKNIKLRDLSGGLETSELRQKETYYHNHLIQLLDMEGIDTTGLPRPEAFYINTNS